MGEQTQRKRVKKRKLHGWRVLLAVLALGVLYLGALVVQVVRYGGQAEPWGDVILVLGASQADGRPRPVLRARLRHAIDLYHAGAAPVLLFTGGRRPGDRFTEAETGRRYALEHGVPEAAILLENAGRTTWQEMQAGADIMRRHGLRRAILVSDPYHGFRLHRMATDLRLPAVFSPTPYTAIQSLEKKARFVVREVGAYAVYRLLGI
ncbi:MAG: hypothetical protein BWY76_02101 [bacterium ADurb.Bin429]|nr:MAG: hypothetical protein BWY76_02101 [bacterium ADurb.Bin429]